MVPPSLVLLLLFSLHSSALTFPNGKSTLLIIFCAVGVCVFETPVSLATIIFIYCHLATGMQDHVCDTRALKIYAINFR